MSLYIRTYGDFFLKHLIYNGRPEHHQNIAAMFSFEEVAGRGSVGAGQE